MNYLKQLTHELNQHLKHMYETTEGQPPHITLGMLYTLMSKAANEKITEDDLMPFRIIRMVDPEDFSLLWRIEDPEGMESLYCCAGDLALLRHMLVVTNEDAPPRPGEPYLIPTRIEGELQYYYLPEHEQ